MYLRDSEIHDISQTVANLLLKVMKEMYCKNILQMNAMTNDEKKGSNLKGFMLKGKREKQK